MKEKNINHPAASVSLFSTKYMTKILFKKKRKKKTITFFITTFPLDIEVLLYWWMCRWLLLIDRSSVGDKKVNSGKTLWTCAWMRKVGDKHFFCLFFFVCVDLKVINLFLFVCLSVCFRIFFFWSWGIHFYFLKCSFCLFFFLFIFDYFLLVWGLIWWTVVRWGLVLGDIEGLMNVFVVWVLEGVLEASSNMPRALGKSMMTIPTNTIS